MNHTKAALALIALITVSVSVTSFSHSITKPFTLDEIEEARMVEKIPKIGPRTFHPDGGGEDLSHPLLYSYTNTLLSLAFGTSEPALRSYGVIFYLATLVILLLMLKERFKEDLSSMRTALFIAASLYLLNPTLIQHSMLINSDNNIVTFSIAIFVYLFFRLEERDGRDFVKSRLIIILAVTFCYMCKEVTPTLLMGGVMAYRLINRQWRRLALDAGAIICGIIIFWCIWTVYCIFSKTDILAFIRYTTLKKGKKVDLEFLIKNFKLFFVLMKWPFYWTGAPFFLLVGVYIFKRMKAFIADFRLTRDDFVWLAAAAIFAPYIFVKASIDMMKYQHPAIPIFIFSITTLLVSSIRPAEDGSAATKEESDRFIRLSLLFLIPASVAYYLIGDYILAIWGAYHKHMGGMFYLYYYAPVLLAFGLVRYLFRGRTLYAAAIWGLLLVLYPISVGLNLNQTRPYTTAEGFLNYGESGLRETARYLARHASEERMVVARKDILYYLEYKHKKRFRHTMLPDRFFFTKSEEMLGAFFTNTPIEYFVYDNVSAVRKAREDILAILSRYFIVEQKFGSFLVLKNKRFFNNNRGRLPTL